jgi:hypothetical protein
LSCFDRAVMVSCPPRWTSTNGAQKDMMAWCPGSLARTNREVAEHEDGHRVR